MKYFIDSNIFLRYLLQDNKKMYQECLHFFNCSKKSGKNIYTSSIIFTEVYWVLLKVYCLPKKEIILFLQSVLSFKTLRFTEFFNLSLALNLLSKHNVKFIDCLISAHSDIQKGIMALVSYDRDFDKLGIKRLEPSDLSEKDFIE